jgi:hypothetical protein
MSRAPVSGERLRAIHAQEHAQYVLEQPRPESSPITVSLVALLMVIAMLGVYGLNRWLVPPLVNFPPPTVAVEMPRQPLTFYGPLNQAAGWRGDCLAINKEWRLVIPDFDSPNCTKAKVLARYAIYESRKNRK